MGELDVLVEDLRVNVSNRPDVGEGDGRSVKLGGEDESATGTPSRADHAKTGSTPRSGRRRATGRRARRVGPMWSRTTDPEPLRAPA